MHSTTPSERQDQTFCFIVHTALHCCDFQPKQPILFLISAVESETAMATVGQVESMAAPLGPKS